MKTAIITDSNSGIFEKEGREKGIYVVPMPVILDGQTYYEGHDISHEEFFSKLTGKSSVSTSQPSAGTVTDLWDQLLGEGYDDIVHMPMSSGLSSTCQTAKMLAEDYDGKVQVVDNRRISVCLRASIYDAIHLREKGLSAKEIKEKLEADAGKFIIYLGVSTLDYFKASGRVTPATATIGNVLNIKPLLYTDGSKFDTVAKVRGVERCEKRLIASIEEKRKELMKDGSKVRIGVAGSFVDSKDTNKWIKMAKDAFPGYDVYYDPLTFSIACHTGPDAFGMGISRVVE